MKGKNLGGLIKMTWNEAMDEVLILSQSWNISPRQKEALDMVLRLDWGNSRDGESARERAEKKKGKA